MTRRRILLIPFVLLLPALLLWPILQSAAHAEAWTLTGSVMYYGDLFPTADVEVAVHAAPGSPPLDATYVPLPGGPFTFTNAPDGAAVYLSAYLDLDGSGGPPDPGEPQTWYDADHDGAPDVFTITANLAGLEMALGDILYVDAQAVGAGDGSSWQDAYTDLQAALAAAPGGAEIWIAAGAYYPTAGSDRSATFQLHSGVALYGGFAGHETLRQARRWQQHRTLLSGDIGTPGVATDNSYNVVTGSGVDRTAVLDGVVVTGGYANGSGIHDKGGGLHNSSGSPTLANVTFVGNFATNHGGGIANQYGGSQPLIVNCIFSGNQTNWNGGAIANLWSAHPTLANVTVTGNDGANGGGIVNLEGAQATVRNSIIYSNTGRAEIDLQSGATISVSYSLVRGGYAGAGNVDADPLFVDAAGPDGVTGTPDDNLRLQLSSPAIDAGSNAAVPADAADVDGDEDHLEATPLDMAGYPRFSDVPAVPDSGSGAPPLVDMGAFEAALLAGDVLVDRAGGANVPDCGRGPNPPCRTIPYAVVSVAAPGDRVLVMPGVYTESVTLRPGIDVIGLQGPALTRIDGEGVRGPLVIAAGALFSPAVTLQGVAIENGSAPQVGGGVQVHDGAHLVISNTSDLSNTAATLDGGISVRDNGAHLTLVNSMLRHNQNTAVWISGGTAVITGCLFEQNQGGSWGGAITGEANSRLTVHDARFVGNTASYGGAIVASETALTLTASRFYSNTAVSQGGALFIHAGSTALVRHSHFAGNDGGDGGAIELAGSSGLLVNNVLLRSSGAQVQIRDGADVTLQHNTLVGSGGGTGIQLRDGAQPWIANNLITTHDVGIAASGVVTPLLSHNLFWQHPTATYLQVTPGAGDLLRDPDLTAQTPDDVRLGVCSWAVDRGDGAYAAGDDFEGDARPVDGDGDGMAQVDIGADERLTVTAPLPLADFSSQISGLTVSFTNLSQHGQAYAWNFGDGTAVVTVTAPDHVYAQPGSYTVTLTVTGAFGCQDVLQKRVVVGDNAIYLPLVRRSN